MFVAPSLLIGPLLVAPLLVGGLAPPIQVLPPVPEPLPVLGGYAGPEDPCRRIGESAATAAYLDDAADLVGCPEELGAATLTAWAGDNRATEVARVDGWVLYSVPRS